MDSCRKIRKNRHRSRIQTYTVFCNYYLNFLNLLLAHSIGNFTIIEIPKESSHGRKTLLGNTLPPSKQNIDIDIENDRKEHAKAQINNSNT